MKLFYYNELKISYNVRFIVIFICFTMVDRLGLQVFKLFVIVRLITDKEKYQYQQHSQSFYIKYEAPPKNNIIYIYI